MIINIRKDKINIITDHTISLEIHLLLLHPLLLRFLPLLLLIVLMVDDIINIKAENVLYVTNLVTSHLNVIIILIVILSVVVVVLKDIVLLTV